MTDGTWKPWFLLSMICPLWAQQEAGDRGQTDNLKIENQGTLIISPDGERVIRGNVRIGLPGVFLLTADEAILDSKSGTVTARGNVKIDFETKLGMVEVTARELNYHLQSLSGNLIDVTAQFGEDFFFEGERLEVYDRAQAFDIFEGSITACNQANPQWSLKIKKASVKNEGYAFIRGTRFLIKGVPVAYLPFLIVPAMQERRSGLLFPETGNSERNGTYYSQPIYFAPRQDLDFTFTPAFFDISGFTLGLETRYKPRLDLSGSFNANVYWDDVIGEAQKNGTVPLEGGKPLETRRYRVQWSHDQPVFDGHLRVRVDNGSDFNVDRDFLKGTARTRIRDYYYRARFDQDKGRNALSIQVDQVDRILPVSQLDDRVIGISRLPEIRFYQPNRAIGKGFYLRNNVSASLFDLEDLGSHRYNDKLLRFGLESELSKSQNLNRFIHTRWGAGYTGSYSRLENEGRGETTGGLFAFLETVGPRLHRTYRLGAKRLVHYADAVLITKYASRDEDPFLESVFLDELDIRIDEQAEGLQAAWKVNSRFFLGASNRVRPLMEVEIKQDVKLDPDVEENPPIDTRIRLLNLNGFQTNSIFEYNPDKGTLDTFSIFGSVNRSKWRGYGGYVKRRTQVGTQQESFIGISEMTFSALRSRLRVAMDYDFETGDFKSQELLYTYQGQCLAINLNYVKSPFNSSKNGNKDFIRITLSLKNLGEWGTKF